MSAFINPGGQRPVNQDPHKLKNEEPLIHPPKKDTGKEEALLPKDVIQNFNKNNKVYSKF